MKNLEQYLESNSMELTNLHTSCPLSFRGELQEIIDAVNANQISLVTNEGELVGMYFNSGLDAINDAIAGQSFARAFSCLPVMLFIQMAMYLKENNIIPDKIVDNQYIYICNEGKVIDLEDNVVCSLDVNNKTKEQIIEALDEQLNTYKSEMEEYYEDNDYEEDECDEDCNHGFVYEQNEGNNEVTDLSNNSSVSTDLNHINYCLGTNYDRVEDISLNDYKKYLRMNSTRFLKKDCDLDLDMDLDVVTISNIEWGRKR